MPTHTLDTPDDAPRLDLLVAGALDLSRNQAATLIAEGHVLVDGRREKSAYRARPGEKVTVNIPEPRGIKVEGEDIPIDVVYEDDSVLVVNKAAGMVVHPAPGNWSGTLVNALKGRGGPLSKGSEGSEASEEGREGIVHRLDKETSGLLLVAKTDRAHRVLGAALQARKIVRRYAALCWGHLTDDRVTIEKPVARDPRDRKRMAIVSTGRSARTDLTRLARFDSADLLRAHLFTGRTHQIRVHLASIGHPVVGDDTYGGGGGRRLVNLPSRRHFLHAAWLVFRHPETGETIDLRAPLPEDLHRALAAAAGPDVSITDQQHANPLEFFGFYNVDT
ncbi:MAG TPA: RluA family pseudouridine synthase [Gemmatimonadaceae bacterium]|nr:RluA family pseudouridine synthase [Gemmatimonadaceae bacterium]